MNRRAAREAVGRIHRDRADPVLAEVLLHFEHERVEAFALDDERVEDVGHALGRKLGVNDGADDLDDLSGGVLAGDFHQGS